MMPDTSEWLDQIEAALPESFFAGLSLPERVQKLVQDWQRMFTGLMPHAKVTKEELIGYFEAIKETIQQDDSFEGNLMYSALEEDCEAGEFKVRILFRHGNSLGQGSMSMIGVMPEHDAHPTGAP